MWLVSKGATVPRPPTAEQDQRQRRFEAVYAAHRGSILGYVLRRTGNPDDGHTSHQNGRPGSCHPQVLAMLAQRDVTVPVFNVDQHGYARNVAHVPGTWYVYDATPWAPHQVMLMVGPTRTQPAVQTPQPGAPVASPTA
jgi:hypothetical protein